MFFIFLFTSYLVIFQNQNPLFCSIVLVVIARPARATAGRPTAEYGVDGEREREEGEEMKMRRGEEQSKVDRGGEGGDGRTEKVRRCCFV